VEKQIARWGLEDACEILEDLRHILFAKGALKVSHDVESIIHHDSHPQILVDCWTRLLCLGSPAVPDIGRNGAGSFRVLAQ
jgi:hypothetical protein